MSSSWSNNHKPRVVGLPTSEDVTSPEKDGAKCKLDTRTPSSTVIYPVLAPVSSQRPPQQVSGGAQSAADAARFHFVYPEGSRVQCMGPTVLSVLEKES